MAPKKSKKAEQESLLVKACLGCARTIPSFRNQVMKVLAKLKQGLAQESEQSKQMLQIYFKQAQGKSNSKELAWANNQFRDIIKGLGLGVLLILPFAPVTLPLLVGIGRKLGFEILPDSFKDLDLK